MKIKKIVIYSVIIITVLSLIYSSIFLRSSSSDILEEIEEEQEQEEVIQIPFSENSLVALETEVNKYLLNMGFNGSFSILYKGIPIYNKNQGRYNLMYPQDTITSSTTFQLASVSKPITSMAVLMLWEQGKINIDNPVKQYILDFPYADITVCQLLNHTSGLQDYMRLVEKNWDENKLILNEDILILLKEHQLPLNFTPGKKHSYSNTGYAMLALLVERVTKTPYHQWVHDNIFEPAGMKTAWIWNPITADTIRNCAIGYMSSSRKARYYSHDKCDEIVGDKSVFCSMNDMICWDKAIRKNLFVSDTTMQKAWNPTKIKKTEVAYGLGWRMKEFGDRVAVYHNGLWNGFTSAHVRFNQEDITILILSNTRNKVTQLTNKVQESVFSILYSDKNLIIPNNFEEDTEIGGNSN